MLSNAQEATMNVVPFTEARDHLERLLDQVVEDAEYTVITRGVGEDAVVMSLESFNSLMETVHLLRSPANAAHLARSIAQYRGGEVSEHERVDD
jgi:antitoxin YefM